VLTVVGWDLFRARPMSAILGIMGSFAQFERERIRTRIHAGWRGHVVTVRSSDASVSASTSATWTGLLHCRCAKRQRCSASLHPASTPSDGDCLEIPPGRAHQIASESARMDWADSCWGISR